MRMTSMSSQSRMYAAKLIALGALALAPTLVPHAATAQPDYHRAERMLTWNTAPLVVNEITAVTWLADSTRFWYRVTRSNGAEFMLVDPVAGTQRPAFDHARLAGAFTRMEAGKKSYEPARLPFQTFSFTDGDRAIRVRMGKQVVQCDLTRYECTSSEAKERPAYEIASPDSQWVAFIQHYNVYVRKM